MHELSIAMSILDVVEEEMENHQANVRAICIRLGPLCGVVKDALCSAFELASENTPYATSQLVFEDAPIVVFCPICDAERPVQSIQHFCCANCDTPASKVVGGRELEIVALELDE